MSKEALKSKDQSIKVKIAGSSTTKAQSRYMNKRQKNFSFDIKSLLITKKMNLGERASVHSKANKFSDRKSFQSK